MRQGSQRLRRWFQEQLIPGSLQKNKGEIKIPLIAVNRINTPEVAENILKEGHSDLVSLARPCLPTQTL